MAMGFGEKVQADIRRLAATERLQLLQWMQTLVDKDLTQQGAVAVQQRQWRPTKQQTCPQRRDLCSQVTTTSWQGCTGKGVH